MEVGSAEVVTVNTVTKPSDLQDKIDKATAAIEAAKRFVWFVLVVGVRKIKIIGLPFLKMQILW